jgi:type I restriction enzyme S subunit
MAETKDFKEPKGLPEGWKWVRLGDKDYFKIVGSGIEYFEGFKNYLSTNSVQGTKITHIEDVITYKNRPSRANMQPKKGKLAFARMRNTVKVLLINENLEKDYILSTGFVLLESKIEPKFVYQYLISDFFNTQKDILAEGTTQEAISNDDFNRIFIIFPENKLEQRKIAEILETVDNAIEKTEKIIEKYKRIKQGFLQDLLTKGIDENGNIRSEKTHKFKDSPIGRIPEEWEVVKLGEVSFITSSKRIYYDEYLTEGVPFFRSKEIIELFNGTFSGATLYISYDKFKNIMNKFGVPEAGDILITAVGTLGVVYLVKKEDLPFYFKDGNLLWLKLREKLNKVYFVKCFNLWYRIQEDDLIIGTSQPALTIEKLKKMLLPLPSLPEQQRIAEILSQIDQTIEKEEQYKEKLERLKQGLMQDLLTGKVRVNHLIEEGAENVST